VGAWVRDAVWRWHLSQSDPRHLLIGEAPLVGERLVELAEPRADAAESLLAATATLFLIPTPTRPVRDHLERARAADVAAPRHAADAASAPPALVSAHWREIAQLAGRPAAGGYTPGVYLRVYRDLLRH